MKKEFECIKGMADNENTNVIVMQGDVVIINETNEGEVCVEGVTGWCSGVELVFTPKQFVEHFRYIRLK